MNTSEKIDLIAGALAAAQGEFPEIIRDTTVKFQTKSGKERSYKYAELSTIVTAIRPALSKHKLSFTQGLIETANGIICRTKVMHASGQWIETDFLVILRDDDMQGMAAAFTYSRRHGVTAALGIATEEDNDGNSALREKAKAASSPTKQKADPIFSEAEVEDRTPVRVQALVDVPNKNKAKNLGFAFDGKKSWIKTMTRHELETTDFPFETRVLG